MATIQNINVGTTTNDGTGDTIRNSFIKSNDNFTSVNSDLALKATLASPTFTGTVNGVTKSMVGLSNVDNTSDVNKPISTATQTALNLKAPLASPTFTGTVTTNSDASVNGIKVGKGGGNVAQNTAIGTDALNSNIIGAGNTAVGYNALTLNTSNSNTAVGNNVLSSNTTGTNNTANGNGALNSNTTGNYNTANGSGSLQYNTTGSYNTAIGLHSLRSNTTGGDSTALGTQALYSNTTGDSNVAVGENALYSNITGSRNTALGTGSLSANSAGFDNVAVGSNSLYNNTTGYYNTATGVNALNNNTTGVSNTAMGLNALSANTTFSNVTGLGVLAQVTASNQVQLGDSATTTYVYGTVQNRSDLRDKADVRDTILGLDFISKLRPVDYKWDMREDYKAEAPTLPEKPTQDPLPSQGELSDEEYKLIVEQCNADYKVILDQYNADCALIMNPYLESVKLDNLTHDGTNKRNRFHHGLIAQEVKDIIEETGVDFGGFQDHKISQGQDVLSIGYDELIAPMIKAIQELKAEIELLKAN